MSAKPVIVLALCGLQLSVNTTDHDKVMCVVHDLGSLEDAPEVVAELYTDDIFARQAEEIEVFVN